MTATISGGILAEGAPLYFWIYVNLFTGAIIGYLVIVGLSATAFQRERDRGTATLLLAAPAHIGEMLHGKMLYYLGLTGKIMGLGCGLPFVVTLMCYFMGEEKLRKEVDDSFFYMLHFAAFVPVAILAAMYGGLRARKGLGNFFIVAIFFIVVGFMFIGSIYECVKGGSDSVFGVSLTFIFYYAGPGFLICLTAFFILKNAMSIRICSPVFSAFIAIFLVTIVLYDLFLDGISYYDPLRREVRWVLEPLCLAFLGWHWLVNKPRSWWIKHLTPGEIQ